MSNRSLLKTAGILVGLVILAIFFLRPPIRKDFTDITYLELESKYSGLAITKGSKQALRQLRDDIGQDNLLAKHCHTIVHALGRQEFQKDPDFAAALSQNDPVCGSGFLHGVIEAKLSASPNPLEEFKTTCSGYEDGSLLAWQCYHGLGHAAMYYTGNDLPKALDSCSGFQTAFSMTNCYQGVFMENFSADGMVHTSKYVDAEQPAYPCATLDGTLRKAVCYMNAPIYFVSTVKPGDYDQALGWCSTVSGFEQDCSYGAGVVYMTGHFGAVDKLGQYCSQSPGYVEDCVRGGSGFLAWEYGNSELAANACKRIEGKFFEICKEAAKEDKTVLFAE